MTPELQKDYIEMLEQDNTRMREAGNNLAIAAMQVAKEYDGVHRLMLACGNWCNTIADEGRRAEITANTKAST